MLISSQMESSGIFRLRAEFHMHTLPFIHPAAHGVPDGRGAQLFIQFLRATTEGSGHEMVQ
jgi:hypothetical protein